MKNTQPTRKTRIITPEGRQKMSLAGKKASSEAKRAAGRSGFRAMLEVMMAQARLEASDAVTIPPDATTRP